MILSGGGHHLGCGTRELIFILRTRHSILPNTKRSFWSMCRINTVPNFDVYQSITLKMYRAVILSPPKRHEDLVNHHLIHMICPMMMKNISCRTIWLKWHLDEEIMQNAKWPPLGSIIIHRMKHQWTTGKLIQISIITTSTQCRLPVHCVYRT